MKRRAVQGLPLALLVVTSSLFTCLAFAQSSVDPQSLIGEWQGTWKGRAGNRETSGGYTLTVERVDGDKVSLKVLSVEQKAREERSVEGKLNGNVLTYGPVELTIDGTTMRGKSSAGRGRDIELMKRK